MPTPEELKKALEEKNKADADAKQRERESAAEAKNKIDQIPMEHRKQGDVQGSVTGAPSIGPSSEVPKANSPAEQEKIDDKLRDKSPESVRADLSAERANPGREGKGTIEHGQAAGGTVQREDGTITSQDHPDETAHYVAGTRVMLRDSDKQKYDALLKEMNELQDNRGISDIAVDDPYWNKKKELDAFAARMKRQSNWLGVFTINLIGTYLAPRHMC